MIDWISNNELPVQRNVLIVDLNIICLIHLKNQSFFLCTLTLL